MFDVLLRFRVNNIALTADIAQAYLEISVNPTDRDFLRFLWYDDITKQDPEIQKLRFTRVIFGASPSQFLLNAVLKMHFEKYAEEDPDFVEKMLKSFYVDDFNATVQNCQLGWELYEKAKKCLKDGHFNLRKWRTNDVELRKSISEKEKSEINDGIGGKILGLKWDEDNDEIILNFTQNINEAKDMVATKRNILKFIAGIYDPLGFIQPLIVSLKIIFQKICVEKIEWDEIVSDEILCSFTKVINQLKELAELRFPRSYFHTDKNDPVKSIELCGFSDGSKIAYGGVVYLKVITLSGKIRVVFITAKSRVVSHSSKFTIPRIELLGNLVLSRLVANVYRALKDELQISRIICFTDSQVTLAWIKSLNKEFTPFVENRVVEIRKNVDVKCWNYVKTSDNPADLITRDGNKVNDF